MAKWIYIDGAPYYLSVPTPDQMHQYLTTCVGQLQSPTKEEEISYVAAFMDQLRGIRINLYNPREGAILWRSGIKQTNWFRQERGVWKQGSHKPGCWLGDQHPCHLVLMPTDNCKRFDYTLLQNYKNGDIVTLGSDPEEQVLAWGGSSPIYDTQDGREAITWYHLDGILFSAKPLIQVSPGEVWTEKLLWDEGILYPAIKEYILKEKESDPQ